MISIKTFLSIALFNFLAISCSKNDETATTNPTNNEPKAFNAADYSEYFVCKVGDYQYNTGNSAGNTTSISTLKIGSTLYLNNSDGNFISGNLASMEINMQFKNFTPNVLKSYEVSGTFPTEILKFKHVGGDNYDTNNGVTITPQANAITITKIENGFYFGTFSFTVYKTSNRATTLQVSEGNFKFKYIP
jgi:hypothetical protein